MDPFTLLAFVVGGGLIYEKLSERATARSSTCDCSTRRSGESTASHLHRVMRCPNEGGYFSESDVQKFRPEYKEALKSLLECGCVRREPITEAYQRPSASQYNKEGWRWDDRVVGHKFVAYTCNRNK